LLLKSRRIGNKHIELLIGYECGSNNSLPRYNLLRETSRSRTVKTLFN
jgi:hypothetical protein